MNQHSIPAELHRRLGLDNNEPSGLGDDRRVAGDAEMEAERRRIFWAHAPENLEDLVGRVKWMTRIAVDCVDNIGEPSGLDKAAIIVRAVDEAAEKLFNLLYGRPA
jgi:hypothetical protein